MVQGHHEQLVHVPEQVVDVRTRGGRVGEVEVPRGVRRPDDPVPTPRDHEKDGLLGPGDEAALRADAVARYHQVDPLARLDVQRGRAAEQAFDVVGPDAGRVHDDAGAHLQLGTRLEVRRAYADDPRSLAQEADDAGPGGD